MLNSSLCSMTSTKEHGRLIGSVCLRLFAVALPLKIFSLFFFIFSQFRISFFEMSPSFLHLAFDTQKKKKTKQGSKEIASSSSLSYLSTCVSLWWRSSADREIKSVWARRVAVGGRWSAEIVSNGDFLCCAVCDTLGTEKLSFSYIM